MDNKKVEKKQYYSERLRRLFWEFSNEYKPESYWDSHWADANKNDIINFYNKNKPNFLLKKINKFVKKAQLRKNAKILEAGCGMGQVVFHLMKEGFDAEGIDFAEETVNYVNKYFGELNIYRADLTNIPKDDSYFDCCVSLGVIEHNINGPEKILKEMHRVTKSNGIVFCSIPTINLVRKIKIIFNKYPKKDIDPNKFYQFAFAKNDIENIFRNSGYELIEKYNYSGLKGLRDEIKILNGTINRIGKLKKPFNIIPKLMDYGIAPISGHMVMYILRVIKKG